MRQIKSVHTVNGRKIFQVEWQTNNKYKVLIPGWSGIIAVKLHETSMYLLNVYTKQLEEYYGHIPEYAILSHTWEEEEVLFQHISGSDDEKRMGTTLKGYSKVVSACDQAEKDGWQYIWIDTCCINKESSAQLSEAINSMYSWYQNARVCYVYLADVRSDQNPRSSYSDFAESRWFTRGWTLQELIAPRSLTFFGSDWVEIGTKSSLRDTISAITWIRTEILVESNVEEASIAERMSWAARRETTRIEDIAYCLMGIFGVNMPLLYGEGRRAFIRLQQEIMSVSDDQTIFAWKATGGEKGDRGLLAHSPADFHSSGRIMSSNEGPRLSPYSMTNKGLQIELPLTPVDSKFDWKMDPKRPNTSLVILRCTCVQRNQRYAVAILLERDSGGCYVRRYAHRFELVDMNKKDSQLSTLFVKEPSLVAVPQSSGLQTLKANILPTSGFTTTWDSNGIQLVSKGKPVIIHFENQRHNEKFAVIIGLHNHSIWSHVATESRSGKKWASDIKNNFPASFYTDGELQCLDRSSATLLGGWSVFVSIRRARNSTIQADIHIWKGDDPRPKGCRARVSPIKKKPEESRKAESKTLNNLLEAQNTEAKPMVSKDAPPLQVHRDMPKNPPPHNKTLQDLPKVRDTTTKPSVSKDALPYVIEHEDAPRRPTLDKKATSSSNAPSNATPSVPYPWYADIAKVQHPKTSQQLPTHTASRWPNLPYTEPDMLYSNVQPTVPMHWNIPVHVPPNMPQPIIPYPPGVRPEPWMVKDDPSAKPKKSWKRWLPATKV